jgi:cytochrome c-type biogenesis protein CcmE
MIILIEINPSINIMRIMLDFLLTNIQIFSLRNLANKKTREWSPRRPLLAGGLVEEGSFCRKPFHLANIVSIVHKILRRNPRKINPKPDLSKQNLPNSFSN